MADRRGDAAASRPATSPSASTPPSCSRPWPCSPTSTGRWTPGAPCSASPAWPGRCPRSSPSPCPRRRARRSAATRASWCSLRDRLAEIRPGAESEQIQFERVRPRTLIMIIVGSIAGYVLLSQLAQVDLIGLLRTADWRWMVVALVLSLVTFIAAAWSLSGFVPERLPLHRTILAQLAGVVRDPRVAADDRLHRHQRALPAKAGLHPALAGASVGVVAGDGLRLPHRACCSPSASRPARRPTTRSTRRSGRSSAWSSSSSSCLACWRCRPSGGSSPSACGRR